MGVSFPHTGGRDFAFPCQALDKEGDSQCS
jgi:hypothetical protein